MDIMDIIISTHLLIFLKLLLFYFFVIFLSIIQCDEYTRYNEIVVKLGWIKNVNPFTDEQLNLLATVPARVCHLVHFINLVKDAKRSAGELIAG